MIRHKTCFFVSIDVLLDTRLTIINEINPDATLEILKNKTYFERQHDNWEVLTDGKISNAEYKEKYAARNKQTLMKSKLTGFCLYLKDFIADAEEGYRTDPTTGFPTILINTYPYQLTENEQQAFIEAMEIQCCCVITDVRICHYSPAELTPIKIKSEYEFLFIYDLEEWKSLHDEAIGRKDMQGVYVTIPKLFINEIMESEVFDVDDGAKMTVWKAAEMCLLPFFNLNFIPVKTYSLCLVME